MTAPDWLVKRGCDLKIGSDRRTWFVLLGGQPQYSVVIVPVGSQFGSVVRQTINGQRVTPSSAAYATVEEALNGGLSDLRQALGWG